MDRARPLWLACKQGWKLAEWSLAAGRYQLAINLMSAPTISQTVCRLVWPDSPLPAPLKEGYRSRVARLSLAQ